MAEDGTPVDPVEPTAPANPTAPEGGEGNPTEPAQESTAQATDATEPTADMPSLLGEADQNDGDQEPAQAAPEAYEPFDVEGQQFTEAQLEGFAATAKELGLSQENAQKMLAAMVPTARQYLVDDLKAKSQEWASLSEKDPEIGGANFKANVGVANQALKQFATPEFTALLRGSGLGAHPEVVRVFYRIGKAMQQDHGVTGSASAPAGARRRYPKSNMVVDDE
jgi:hypothetical protein|nr:MAG TPA: putative protease [Caudoviricetes sp.]